jgi:hypothetical protein
MTPLDKDEQRKGAIGFGSGKNLVFPPGPWTIGRFSRGDAVVEWRIKLEARTGWGEIETIEVAHFERRVVG